MSAKAPRSDQKPREPSARSGDSPPLQPGLYVVATPIGNLRDITLRALDVLAGVDLIAAEDTRVTAKLLNAYGLAKPVIAYHDHSDARARGRILDALAAGQAVALVSDAGTPLVSDPGYRLVGAALEAGHRVFPIPGASALLAAASVSGLPTDRFLFAGFPPAKAVARRRFFADLAATPATLVFFETGPRLAESLADMAAAFGDRPAAVARELTKLFEEVRRQGLAALAAAYAAEPAPKGEIVVLVGPPPPAAPAGPEALDAALRESLAAGLGVKDAARAVAARLGASASAAYARALILKEEGR